VADNGAFSGAAYVFTRSSVNWSQQQKVVPIDGGAGQQFGTSVSVSGNSAAMGAPFDDDVGSFSGSAYVYSRTAGVWSLQQKLVASDEVANDRFGTAVSLFGNSLLVGSPQDGDLGTDSGSAYAFVASGSAWTQKQKLVAGASGALLGSSVAAGNLQVVLGAPGEGKAYASGPPIVVPAMNQWWALAFALSLLGLGFVQLRRSRSLEAS
jgi:hypothetical protein